MGIPTLSTWEFQLLSTWEFQLLSIQEFQHCPHGNSNCCPHGNSSNVHMGIPTLSIWEFQLLSTWQFQNCLHRNSNYCPYGNSNTVHMGIPTTVHMGIQTQSTWEFQLLSIWEFQHCPHGNSNTVHIGIPTTVHMGIPTTVHKGIPTLTTEELQDSNWRSEGQVWLKCCHKTGNPCDQLWGIITPIWQTLTTGGRKPQQVNHQESIPAVSANGYIHKPIPNQAHEPHENTTDEMCSFILTESNGLPWLKGRHPRQSSTPALKAVTGSAVNAFGGRKMSKLWTWYKSIHGWFLNHNIQQSQKSSLFFHTLRHSCLGPKNHCGLILA